MSDFDTDKRVKKKLLLVMSAWNEQYKDDPNMHFVAGILKHYGGSIVGRTPSGGPTGPSQGATTAPVQDDLTRMGLMNGDKEKKKNLDILTELSRSERTKEKKEQKKKKQQNQRVPFNFERVHLP